MTRRAFSRLIGLSCLMGLASCAAEQDQEAAGQPASASVYLSPPADAPAGRQLFFEKCEMCHGESGMGTGLLARRIEPAELLKRKDLAADYVVIAVRQGVGNMPAMPRGELSDAELDTIAQYLAGQGAQ